MHNRVIAAVGNNSGSNDHNQHKHDMNGKLIAAAGKFASGKNLGLSEEETLALMSRELRRQKRGDDSLTMNDIERQFAQAGNSLADVSESGEIRGVSLREEPEVDPFGQDQGQYYEYGPDDNQYDQQQVERTQEMMADMEDRSEPTQRDPYGARRYDKTGNVVLKSGVSPDEYDGLTGDLENLNRPRERTGVAPKSVLTDALGKLQSAKDEQKGFQSMIAKVLGGGDVMPGYADAETRLQDDINSAPVERDISRELSRRMNEQDLAGTSGRRAAYNNIKAAIEAEGIGEQMYGNRYGPGAVTTAEVADETIARIGRANAAPGMAAFNVDGVPLDPGTQAPIGQQGPQMATPNSDQSSEFNAPMTTRNWMVEKQPGYREGGRAFGDYPQTDVTGATTLFADRIRGVEGFERVSPNIRGVDELQRAADAMIAKGPPGKSKNFFTKEVVDGKMKSTKQTNPDIRGVLNALRYTPAQEAQLANALYQMEAAKATQINQQGKQQFFTRTGPGGGLQPTGFGGTTPQAQQASMQTPGGAQVFFDSPEAIDPRDGQTPVARVNPGQTIEGRDIPTAFRGLDSPGARSPFIGQVEGEAPRINRYNTTGETDPVKIEGALRRKEEQFAVNKAKTSKGRIMPVDEGALRGKVVKAQLAEERATRDDRKRREQERTVGQYTMANPNNIGRVTSARRRMGG